MNYKSANEKKTSFNTFLLCRTRMADKGYVPFLPFPILYDTVWDYIILPHEQIWGPNGKWVKKYNSVLRGLPRPQIYPGPRIMHSFGLHSRHDIVNFDGINVPRIRQLSLVKFIYTLHHAKDPHSYITIHVYTTMEAPSSNDEKHHRAYSLQRIKYLRSRYMDEVNLPDVQKRLWEDCGITSSQTD